MIQGMTGFGSAENTFQKIGMVRVEIRSTNHKFLETVLHVPEGLISVEDKIKKTIEGRLKRGRVTCVVAVSKPASLQINVNMQVLTRYLAAIKEVSRRYKLAEKPAIDTLINLPGVLNVAEQRISSQELWPSLQKVLDASLDDLTAMRRKEGQALGVYLKTESEALSRGVDFVQQRFKKAIKAKVARIVSDIERASFLKEADISEELQRLAFHAKSFKGRLSSPGPVGKELDFICQEMQREANTIGAKSCDVEISAKVVQIKSQIEKLREQVQNAE